MNADQDRTIFVAGHRGMVGSAIVRRLRETGYGRILTADRQALDLLNQAAVRSFFAKHRIDMVYLAAANWDAVAEWSKDQNQLEILPVWGAHLAQAADRLTEFGLDASTVAAAACDTFEMNGRIAEHLGAEENAVRLPLQVTLYPGLDLTISDSIHWAYVMDSYIATIGSGLTTVTWIAGRPGIAHSEPAHLGQMEFWHQVRSEVVPPITDIRAHGEAMYANHEIDTDVFL